jgi:hypothetical protein
LSPEESPQPAFSSTCGIEEHHVTHEINDHPSRRSVEEQARSTELCGRAGRLAKLIGEGPALGGKRIADQVYGPAADAGESSVRVRQRFHAREASGDVIPGCLFEQTGNYEVCVAAMRQSPSHPPELNNCAVFTWTAEAVAKEEAQAAAARTIAIAAQEARDRRFEAGG